MTISSDRPLVEKTQLALTDNQIIAIGKVTAEWSLAENILEHFLWVLIPTDQKTGRAITTHMSSELRCNAIRLLAHDLPNDLKNEALTLISRFEEVRVKRNTIVHNIWAGEPSDQARAYKPSARRGQFRLNATRWSEEDILSVHTQISIWAVNAVNYLNQKLWWPPSERTLFGQFVAAATARNAASATTS